jgi:ferrous iron transport protein A
MIPLILADSTSPLLIQKVSTDDTTKRHLENLGILPGAEILIISKNNGNIILKVKEGRLAVDKSLATKIFVAK